MCLRSQQALERVEVMRPAVLVAALPEADLGAGAARDLDRRAVARRLHDGVIAGREQRVVGDEDALLGGGEREHVVGPTRSWPRAIALRSSSEPGTSV